MSLPRIIDRLLCLGVLLALGAGVQARETDRQKPMDVEADHSQSSTAEDGPTHLWGNVHSTQGTLEIKADDAVLTRTKGDLSRAVLKGNPVYLKQEDEDGQPMTATAQHLDYDLVKKVAVLTGNAIITQPRGVMRGERVVYDIGAGQVTSGGDGTRVKMHIEPKQTTAAPAQTEQEKKDRKAKKAAKKAAAAAAQDANPTKTDASPPASTNTPPPVKNGSGNR